MLNGTVVAVDVHRCRQLARGIRVRRALSRVLALVGLAVGTFAPTSSNAQTTANGPYYAWPSWDQTLPANTRFVVLANMGSNAVLDRESGLVWDRAPSAAKFTWLNAQVQCIVSTVGNREGWRLPGLQELQSLRVPASTPTGSALLTGHPFVLPNFSTTLWTSTSVGSNPTSAFTMSVFGDGSGVSFLSKAQEQHVWCVRGGQGPDTQF